MDEEKVLEFLDILEALSDDLSTKPKGELMIAIGLLRSKKINDDILFEFRDQLELVGNLQNVDTYTRNEISNIIAELEEYL
jgi:hypothetical protein